MALGISRAGLVALLLAPGLGACGSDDPSPQRGLGSVATLRASEPGDDAVDFEPGDLTVTQEDIDIIAGNRLPDGFPESEVPLGDLRIGGSARMEDGSFLLVTAYHGSAAKAVAAAKAKLQEVGFEVDAEATVAAGAGVVLTNEAHIVTVVDVRDVIWYNVRPRESPPE